MDVPVEMYLVLFVMAGDLEATKSLRSVSKNALKASYYYFKILLKQHLRLYYDGWHWNIIDDMRSDEELQSDIKNEEITDRSRGHILLYRGLLAFEEFVGIKNTVEDLLNNKKFEDL